MRRRKSRRGVASRFGHPGIDDVADVTFAYPDGSVATLVSVWHQVMSRPSTRRVEVFCEDALLWADDDHLGPLHVETGSGTSTVPGTVPEWVGRLGLPDDLAVLLAPYAVAAKAFLDALAAGSPGMPSAATALVAHRLVDLAYRSAAAGGAPLSTSRSRPPGPEPGPGPAR